MENIYYTYAYLRENGTPYYIGKGKKDRAYKRKGRRCATPKDKSRILILKRGLTEEEAHKHEVYLIAVLGRKDKGTGILRNLTDGGEGITGAKRTAEFCNRISEIHSGKTISEPHKRALRKAHKGRKLTEEHKRKVGDALRGKKKPPRSKEHIEKLKENGKKGAEARWGKKE